MPKVSVIIPLYNGTKFIKKTLESALNQTHKDFEVIVVNDGSTDNPEKVLKPYLSKIKFITQENSGCPAGAINTGIKESDGEYIAFLDQDDIWAKDKLEKQSKILDQKPKVGLVATNMIIFEDETKKKLGVLWKKIKKYMSPREAQKILLKYNFVSTPSAVMVRRAVFDDNRYCDDRFKLADDYELWYRISRKWFFGLILEPLTYYRFYTKSLSKNQYKLIKDTALFYKIASHDVTLTEKERKFALKQEALYNFRLANICMATNNFAEAKKIYKTLQKKNQFKNKIKTINSLNRISPKMAGTILKIKKELSTDKNYGFNKNLTI